MGNAIWPLALIVLSNLCYQSCSKSASPAVSPFAALVFVYLIAAAGSFVFYLVFDGRGLTGLWQSIPQMNWANFLMGLAIVGLEGGFLYLYKTGWSVSVGPIITYTCVALGLLAVGALFYHEHITLRQILGTLVCLGGIALVAVK